jgi:hypothetical protein
MIVAANVEGVSTVSTTSATTKFSPLPPNGSGYYIYSPSSKQFGTADTVSTLLEIARQQHWNIPGAPIGIGDLSLEDGAYMAPHYAHRLGRNVDIRPFRKDRHKMPTNIRDPNYDRELTRLLVENLLAHKNVHRILFNDTKIHGVHKFPGHDDHLRVATRR